MTIAHSDADAPGASDHPAPDHPAPDPHDHHDDYDPDVGFHPSCVTDPRRPTFEQEWQRRAFGLAVALSEFGHYPWEEFQGQLIRAIGSWEDAPTDAKSRWEYYEHWVSALGEVVGERGLLADDYVMPEDRPDGIRHATTNERNH